MEEKLYLYKADYRLEGEWQMDKYLILPDPIDNYKATFQRPVTGIYVDDTLYINVDMVPREAYFFFMKEVWEYYAEFKYFDFFESDEYRKYLKEGARILIGDGYICFTDNRDYANEDDIGVFVRDYEDGISRVHIENTALGLLIDTKVCDHSYYSSTDTFIVNGWDLYHPYSEEGLTYILYGYDAELRVDTAELVAEIDDSVLVKEIVDNKWMYEYTPDHITRYKILL